MADLDRELNSSGTVKITGRTEEYVADVVEENGVFKLLTKSTVVPVILGNRFTRYALNGGSNELAVNGGGTSVVFEIAADVTYDLIVSSMIFQAFAGGIKLDKFLSQNSELSTGISIEVKSEDSVFNFLNIKNTIEFDSLFAQGTGRSFNIEFASGDDSLVSRFSPSAPFVIAKQGTYATDDYIRVTVNDNLNSISRLRFLAEGSLLA